MPASFMALKAGSDKQRAARLLGISQGISTFGTCVWGYYYYKMTTYETMLAGKYFKDYPEDQLEDILNNLQ